MIAASNVIIKVLVDPATGVATVQNDPADPTRVQQVKVGKNPRGIVINSTDTRAYVMNYISRDISVMDLAGTERVLDTKLSANLPAPGTPADKIQVGKELYNTSVGEFDPAVLKACIRKGAVGGKLMPVFCGSSYRNKGVQQLLDGGNERGG